MNVLIVDDDKEIRAFLRALLTGQGHAVTEAANGQEGLASAREQRPDAIICDGLMPVMDGFQLLQALKRDAGLSSIPFIFLSAVYTGQREHDLAMSLGADAFLVKPQPPKAILNALRAATGGRVKAARTNYAQNGDDPAVGREYSLVVATALEGKVGELRTASDEWRATFDAMNDAIALLDRDGRILRCNKAMARLVNKSYYEIIGQYCWKIVHNASDPVNGCPHTAMRKSKKRETGVLLFNARWFEVTAEPFFDNGGELIGAVHIMKDITERRRLEDELKASVVQAEDEKARTDSIISAIGDGISIQDRNFKILYQNQAFKTLVGDHRGELCYQAYEKREKRCEGCGVAQVFEDGGTHIVERSAPSDKGLLYAEITASPLRDAQGNIVAGIEVVHNITERKQQEAALRASEERYRLLFQHSPVCIFQYDTALKVTDCNKQFADLLQTSTSKLINLDMHALRDQRVIASIQRAIDGMSGAYEGEYEYQTRMGLAAIVVSMHTAPLLDSTGAVIGGIGIVEDITQRKESERQLQKQQRFTEGLILNSVIATFVLDASHRVLIWNKASEELTGVPAAEMLGTKGQWKPFYDSERPVLADIVLSGNTEDMRSLYPKTSRSPLMPDGIHAEKWLRGLNGKDRYLVFDATPIRDASGAIIAAVETLQDFTESKTLEERIHRAKQDWEFTFNSITDMVTIHDADYNIILANKAAEKILHLPLLEKMKGTKCFSYYHGTDHAPEGCPSCGCLQTGVAATFEIFEPHLNMFIEIRAIPRFDSNNQLIGLIHVVRDITERKRAEESLTRYSRELTALNTASNTLMVITNLKNIYAYICDIIYEVFDLKMVWLGILEPETYNVKPVAHAGHEDGYLANIKVTWDDSTYGMGPTGMAIKTKKSFATNIADPAFAPWSGPARQRGYVASLAVPLIYARDKCIGALNFYSDDPGYFSADRVKLCEIFANQAAIAIENAGLVAGLETTVLERTRALEDMNSELQTLNKELELRREEAESASRSKTDFLANMSHELRTPLNAIMGFSEIMLMGMAGPVSEKQKEFLNDISGSGGHLLNLINDILDLSKVEAGKMELEPELVIVKELISGSLMMFKEKALKHALTMETSIDPAVPELVADRRKLKQVLVNLVSNACKFTPDGGSVRVSARRVQSSRFKVQGSEELNTELRTLNSEPDAEFIEISVADTGVGISKEHQEKLFQPFMQIDSSLTRNHAGTGLGLSLCKRFIELHGGRIWVESEPGKGSTFRFVVPIRQEVRSEK